MVLDMVHAGANIMDDSPPTEPVPLIDHARLLEELRSPALRLLNVLPFAYFREKRIPGSLSLPYTDIPERHPTVLPDKSANIVVYCAGPT
jgi:rhodanese-related sulfurtransferase